MGGSHGWANTCMLGTGGANQEFAKGSRQVVGTLTFGPQELRSSQ